MGLGFISVGFERYWMCFVGFFGVLGEVCVGGGEVGGELAGEFGGLFLVF